MGDKNIEPVPEEESFPEDAFTDDQRRNGAVLLHIIGTLYMIYAGIVLCYYFFVPSILLITRKLKIKHDVAGAIFVGACTSLPDLLFKIYGAIVSSTDERSFGQFVGSSVFIILVLVAVGGFATKEALRLNKWPIFRDLSFYVLSVILLFIFFVDNSIAWYETGILISFYTLYLVGLAFNNKIEQKLNVCLKISQEPIDPSTDDDTFDQESPISLAFPKGGVGRILLYLITIPILAPLYLTLPDTRNTEFTIFPSFKIPGSKLFIWTFIGSIIWMWVFGFCFVWWTTILGKTLGIPSEVMGLTYAAFGLATPIIATIVLVVRKGKGNMALSTAFGLIIFQYTFLNPLPWLISCIITNSDITANSAGSGCSLTLLILMIIGFMVTLLVFRWKLRKLLGLVLIILYILFVCVSLAFIYDVVQCPV